ncbi:hypothetical protein ACJDT4_06905 [Clostridium neuense]|uniref:Uncharacterized protein n=1 Tax=Clostridium neuense TaxID=1728934 RepID=A0ABW8TEK3_9CLOT
MKYKHEKEIIRNIAMLALPIVLILGKLGKVKIEIMIAYVCSLFLISFGIYCIYKGLKLGGAFFFSLAIGTILVILSYHYDSYVLAVPIPGSWGLGCVFSYKLVCMTGDKEKIKRIKKGAIIVIALCSMIQVLMIALLFIKN